MRKASVINSLYFEERTKLNEKTGCLEWTLHRNRQGYGSLKHKGKQWAAHRLMWTLTYGSILEGLNVCHKCDNPSCVNIKHLFLGTTQDNINDKMQKGRFRPSYGEANGYSKLTEAQVQAIRADCRTQYAIAEAYGISQGTVSEIKIGRAWSWLHSDVPEDKKLNIKEFAELVGVPYMPLKDRIHHRGTSLGYALAVPYKGNNALGKVAIWLDSSDSSASEIYDKQDRKEPV